MNISKSVIDSVPILHMDMDEEAEVASEEDECVLNISLPADSLIIYMSRYGDSIGVDGQGPPGGNIFDLASGFANAISEGFVNTVGRGGHPMLWGTVRSGRRRGVGK